MLNILVILILWLPLLAAGVLVFFPLALRAIQQLPEHEYAQAVRAPSWFTVAIGGGCMACAMLALRHLAPRGEQFFIGDPRSHWVLMGDAYTLWCAILLGAILLVAAWTPAARRSSVPRAVPPFLVTLVLAWHALLMVFSLRLDTILGSWLALLVGVLGLWIYLYRPKWHWTSLELPLVLLLAGVLGSIGLSWLNALAQGTDLINAWSTLLAAPPRAVNGALLLIVLGWLGPAVYLPWWAWGRDEEAGYIWLPSALLLAVAAPLVLVRIFFFAFPVIETDAMLVPGMTTLLSIRGVLEWLSTWGLLALLVGAGWLVYLLMRARRIAVPTLRPLVLVATGLMLVGMVAGVQAKDGQGIPGLLWLQLVWVGILGIWLASHGILPALTNRERSERLTLYVALGLALATLVALPPTAGFHSLVGLWGPLKQTGRPVALILLALFAAVGSTGYLLPRWAQHYTAREPRPGVRWGILAPFAFAFLLVICGLFGGSLNALFAIIRDSLLQRYF